MSRDAKQLLHYRQQGHHRPLSSSSGHASPSPSQWRRKALDAAEPLDGGTSTAESGSAGAPYYELTWSSGPLGLRFTPDERDAPVVCQVTPRASEAVQLSPVAVGDVLVGVRQLDGATPRAFPIATLEALVRVFREEPLPLSLRFRSRAAEAPAPLAIVDIARSYTHTWAPGAELGLSLAMDPCSLHTIITAVDQERACPELRALAPAPGDILISVRGPTNKVDLDRLRFSEVIDCLRAFARPCKLTFARLHVEMGPSSPTATMTERPHSKSLEHVQPPPPPSSSSSSSSSSPPPPPPMPQRHRQHSAPPSSPPAPPPPHSAPGFSRPDGPRRPAPLLHRQSFTVEEMTRGREAAAVVDPKEAADRRAKHNARFFKLLYAGGDLGFTLKDARVELKGRPKKNGYVAVIKKITNKRAYDGQLHREAAEGDELIAIGDRDLQHVPFEDVQAALGRIREPTPLVFQRRPRPAGSVGASLVDGLLLFLI